MQEKQFDETLLSLLVCPKTRGRLTYDSETNTLISKDAALAFPIKDGIPLLLIEEAHKL